MLFCKNRMISRVPGPVRSASQTAADAPVAAPVSAEWPEPSPVAHGAAASLNSTPCGLRPRAVTPAGSGNQTARVKKTNTRHGVRLKACVTNMLLLSGQRAPPSGSSSGLPESSAGSGAVPAGTCEDDSSTPGDGGKEKLRTRWPRRQLTSEGTVSFAPVFASLSCLR